MFSRRKCPWCHQELSHSAYYRHIKDSQGLVCPARRNKSIKQQPFSSHDDSTSTCSEDSESTSSSLDFDNSDSSFSFHDSRSSDNSVGHCHDREEAIDGAQTDDSDIMDVDSMLEESQGALQWSDCSLDDEEEIWDTSSDEESCEQTDQVMINFFQLFYRVSERAILALLAFLRVHFFFWKCWAC